MGPESETTITPANLSTATTRFERARDRFALGFARGHNMFSSLFGRDRLEAETVELRESILQVAEYQGRASVTSGTLPGFRAELAVGTARAYQDAANDVVVAATEAVQTPGVWTGLSRLWNNPETNVLKLITAAGLIAGHFVAQSRVSAQELYLYDHIAVAGSAVGLMDFTRALILDTTSRSAAFLPRRVAELIRRKSSRDEGVITGDVNALLPLYGPNPSEVMSGVLEDMAEDALRETAEANDIQRPPLTRYDVDWTSGLRRVIQYTLRPFDLLQELIRSRDIAARSRLVRTALALAIIGGSAGHYLTNRPVPLEVRAENCPIKGFPDLNEKTRRSLGLDNIAHFSGIAQAKFYKRATGIDFNDSPEHADQLQRLIDEDRVGNLAIIDALTEELRTQNPQVKKISTDSFAIRKPDGTGVLIVDICDPETENRIYNRVNKSPTR